MENKRITDERMQSQTKQKRQPTKKRNKSTKELTHNPHIVINIADKGNTIVIEDRREYIKNAMTDLNDRKYS